MDRANHYESAFEAYLRHRRLGYLAIDEARRSLFEDDGPVKSLDFVVYGPGDVRFLVDVKGRRYPGGPAAKPRRVWENWVTADDLAGLDCWRQRFGAGYQGLLVFAYHLRSGVNLPTDTPDLWAWHDRTYLLRAVLADAYRRHMAVRSPRWGTVCLPRAVFRELVRPVSTFLHPGPVPAEGGKKSLSAIMDEMGARAEQRGLTPETLVDILGSPDPRARTGQDSDRDQIG